MAGHKVIVFGPTGGCGSAAARTAAELGAKVVLAMRDTSKPIPGLSAEQEKAAGSFERVQADLTDASSVRDAVAKTGATSAFFYLNFAARDGMKPVVEALKEGGIQLPVFLSSFSVQGELKDIPMSDAIPWAHAQVEMNLIEVFGKGGFVALRPAYFASNVLQLKDGIVKGVVKLHKPEAKIDTIVPEDIGRVGGTILANGKPSDGNTAIYLIGPELRSNENAMQIIGKALGKDIKIEQMNDEETLKYYTASGWPEPVAQYMVDSANKPNVGERSMFGIHIPEEQSGYVQKYSGKRSTTFEEWVQDNKQLFA